jgi:hypothetical protein
MIDFIIIAVIAACVIFSIVYSRKRKKSGQSSCCGSCGNCGVSSCSDKH